jgi:hypothetical protein
MTALKDRIFNYVRGSGQVSEWALLNFTTEEGDVLHDDVIKEAIKELVQEGKIIENQKMYAMPSSFYHIPVVWGWESYLKLVDPWDGVEKKFSSGEWIYSSWRRELGDEMRWVREPIPKILRDGMQIQRQWMCNAFWRYSLVAPDGIVYTLREEVNDCD